MTAAAAPAGHRRAIEAERWLVGRELFGVRPGLGRMHRLLERLGEPQRQLRTVHVVGSNGKTSTATLAAQLLGALGLRSGAYVSPHLVSFRERILLDGAPVAPEPFADTLDRVRAAAEALEAATPTEPVTQFEAGTAAALVLLAEAGVHAAVLEAGLGGRLDATNVLVGPGVVALTAVALEHTRWLGRTEAEIAAEKVAVLQEGGTLVLGAGLSAEAERVARERAAACGARVVPAPADPGPGVLTPGAPPFQRRNLATADASVRALLAEAPDLHGPLDPDGALARVAGRLAVSGRFEVVGHEPLELRDGAHNPAGARALAEALHVTGAPRPRIGVLGVRRDKDVGGLLAALVGELDGVVACDLPVPGGLEAVPLGEQAARVWAPEVVQVVSGPADAVARARALAGPEGTVVVAGSLHLLAALARPDGAGAPATF